jgi:hypothetical protein
MTPSDRIKLGLVSAGFLAMGAVFTYGALIEPFKHFLDAREWKSTTCEIVSSRVYRQTYGRYPDFRLDITYRYTVGGRAYVGTRYKLVIVSSNGYGGMADIVARLLPGTRTECWFDPASPSEAVIDRGLSASLLGGLVPLIFVIAGGVGLYFALFGTWKTGVLPMSGP